jgi:hypothetical protein
MQGPAIPTRNPLVPRFTAKAPQDLEDPKRRSSRELRVASSALEAPTAVRGVPFAENRIKGQKRAPIRSFCNIPAQMTMLRLTGRQRDLAADKLADVGNLAAGALIFGQSLGGAGFSTTLAFVGLLVWILCLGFAVRLRRGMP